MKKNNSIISNLIFAIAFLLNPLAYAQDDVNFIPAEQFVCLSNPVSFQISPDGKHMLITNTNKDNVCDIEQDKVKQIEDAFYDRGLLLMNLDTKETTMLSDGSLENGISAAGWLNNDRIWFRPRYKMGQSMKAFATYAMNIDGSKRTEIKEGGRWQQIIYNKDYSDPSNIYVITNERRDVYF